MHIECFIYTSHINNWQINYVFAVCNYWGPRHWSCQNFCDPSPDWTGMFSLVYNIKQFITYPNFYNSLKKKTLFKMNVLTFIYFVSEKCVHDPEHHPILILHPYVDHSWHVWNIRVIPSLYRGSCKLITEKKLVFIKNQIYTNPVLILLFIRKVLYS